ncbi:hypothetical protein D3C80_1879380 [compost metagenome]
MIFAKFPGEADLGYEIQLVEGCGTPGKEGIHPVKDEGVQLRIRFLEIVQTAAGGDEPARRELIGRLAEGGEV